MKRFVTMMVAMVLVAGASLAGSDGMKVAGGGKLKACSATEMARYKATHVLELNCQDMTLTNVASSGVTWTNTVTAPCSVRFEGYVLEQAFDSATTNPGPYSLKFYLGTTTTSNKWINGVEVAADSTPTVYGSFGTDYTVSCMASGQAAVVTSPLIADQSSNVSLLASLSQVSTNALNSLSAGKLRAYFSVLGQNYP